MTTEPSLQELAQIAMRSDADQPAVRDATNWYDWGWLRDTGENIVDLLDAGGISYDRPVGLVARNRPVIAAALLALIASGRSVRMLHAFQSARMLAKDVASGRIAALIATDDDISLPVAETIATHDVFAISVHEESGIGMISGDAREGGSINTLGFDPYIEVLTSGTTGYPKHFRLSHELIRRRLLSMNVTYSEQESGGNLGRTSLMFYPLGTISGLYSYLPPALDARPIILQEKFDLDGWLDFVTRYRPWRASLPPPGIDTLLSRKTPPAMLASLQHIGTGAAPVDINAQTAFEDHFGIPLLISYGATEFGGPVAAMTKTLRERWGTQKRGSAGPAWAGARLRIVDPATGAVLPPGEDGILEVISPVIGDDWIRTSDLAMLDTDAFLYHRGRADGAITRGGFSILPEVIERAIVLHPQVAAAAVVGLPHQRLGEVPVAAIQPKNFDDPPDSTELEHFIRDHVYATHVPTQFRIVRELPLNRSMKVDLARVRAMFEKKASA